MYCFPQEGAILHLLPQDTFVPRPYPLWKALPLVFFTCSQNRSTAAGQRECPVHPRLDRYLTIVLVCGWSVAVRTVRTVVGLVYVQLWR